MKCKNCGADYRTVQMKCPYCGTETRLGRIWFTERSEAEKAYDEARLQRKQKYSPFILNRWLNRGILIVTSVIVLCFLIIFGAFFLAEAIPAARYKAHSEEIEAQLHQALDAGDYRTVREIMQEYDLYGSDHYIESQASFLQFDYQNYLAEKYATIEDIDQDGTTDELQISIALMYARRFQILSLGNYSLLSEKNEAYYNAGSEDIRAFLVGYLGMTEEEWEVFSDGSTYSYSTDEMAATLLERRGWAYEG